MFQFLCDEEIKAIFEIFKKENPNPKTELRAPNPYTLLVSVVLSAQMTDKGVNKATEPLYKIVDTPEKMLALGEEKLVEYIKTIGLYRAKAKYVMGLSKILVEKHQSQVPQTREELEALPGVGRKTASVILNAVYGKPTMPVDTHLLRISPRMGFSCQKTPLGVEQDLLAKIPEEYLLNAHHWLVLHGRYVCVARNPHCATCSVAHICKKNTEEN